LAAAMRVARALQRRIFNLAKSGRLVPVDRAQRLSTQAKKLAEGAAGLAKSDFCSRHSPRLPPTTTTSTTSTSIARASTTSTSTTVTSTTTTSNATSPTSTTTSITTTTQ